MKLTTRRVATGVGAVLIGFSAPWIALNAGSSATPDEKPATLLGTLDFAALCRSQHGPQAEAVHLRLDAYGWRCFFTKNGVYQQKDIDIPRACEVLFDGDVYSSSFDLTSGMSWQCFRGPKP